MKEEPIYETYSREICTICKNKENCQEELRVRIDGSMKCDNYETTFKKKKGVSINYWQKW